MKVKLSQIKSKKCHCGTWDQETGVECEACPFDSSFSKFHYLERGYFCKIDDFKRGLIEDQEIDLQSKSEEGDDSFEKGLLKFLEIEGL